MFGVSHVSSTEKPAEVIEVAYDQTEYPLRWRCGDAIAVPILKLLDRCTTLLISIRLNYKMK
jgi:hypothetical protein